MFEPNRYCAEIVSNGTVVQTECFISPEKAVEWANTVLSDMETWRVRDRMRNNRIVVREIEE